MFRLYYNRAQLLGYRPYPGAKLHMAATDITRTAAMAQAEGGGKPGRVDGQTCGGDRAYWVLHKWRDVKNR
jgi:hypothetical protein